MWFMNQKPPFSVANLVTGTQPYGKWFGLDGVHPTQAGQNALARAAILAINGKYGFDINPPSDPRLQP
jgi:lysophospholipase L1-like esterase